VTSRCSTGWQLLGRLELLGLHPKSLYTEDGRYLKRLPKDFYATKTYTDKMISYIDANHGDGKPFFAYVSHQARTSRTTCRRSGATATSASTTRGGTPCVRKRLKRQVEMGIVPRGAAIRTDVVRADATLLAPAARAVMGKKMEIYAGLVENLDYHVGRLIDHLKKIGEYDNTIFIVFGDNGARATTSTD